MLKNLKLKTLLPYGAAIVIFYILTAAYFNPVLEGKRLEQNDIKVHLGSSKEIADFREKTGEEALWTNSMFGGMPAYQISVLYKNNISNFFERVLRLWMPHPASIVLMYMIGFFILLLVLGVNPWLSIVGSVAFAFSSYFFIILQAGHNTKAMAIAYMAPVLAGIILTFRGKYLAGGVLTAIFMALEIKANHLQITYYLGMIVFILGLAELVHVIKTKQLLRFAKAVGVLLVALILSVGVNITNLWVTWEYTAYSTRGKSELTLNKSDKTSGLDRSYATAWSYGIGETMTLLIPNARGGASEPIGNKSKILDGVQPEYKGSVASWSSYWGEQPFTSGPVYVGAIIFFLFLLGCFIVKGRLKWVLLIATLVSLIFAWGNSIMSITNLLLDYLPGYNKFRAVSMALVIAELTMPLLAILAVKEIIQNPDILKIRKRGFWLAFGFSAGISLLLWIAPSMVNFISSNDLKTYEEIKKANPNAGQQLTEFIASMNSNLEIARTNILKADAMRSFWYILLAAALVFFYGRKKIRPAILIAGLGILILADLWIIDRRYLSDEHFVAKTKMTKPYLPTAADEMILQDTTHYRVLNAAVNTFNDASTSYFHHSIGGYHGAKMERYQELIEYQISQNNFAVLNMLNTKYFIVKDKEGNPVAQQNPEALGNAWFVDTIKMVLNADSEIMALSHFNPKTTAIVDQRFKELLKDYTPIKDSTASIQLVNYKPNHLTYRYKSQTNKPAVFSEIYYSKGWIAYVDGKEIPYFRANYVLRAALLPAGEHTVDFIFKPRSYYVGEKVSLVASILLGLFLVLLVFFEVKRFQKSKNETAA